MKDYERAKFRTENKNAAAQIMGSRNVEAKHRKENPYVLSEN